MLLFLWQIFPVSFGQKSNTAFEILLLARDCFGRAVWVRRITRRRTPANRRKSPSMPRCRMRNGFSFDRIKVEDISSAMSIPTTVDLEHKIASSLLLTSFFNYLMLTGMLSAANRLGMTPNPRP